MTRAVNGGRGSAAAGAGRYGEGAGSDAGQILRWNLFIGGHLSSSVPVRLVERTDEGQWVWLESGTPMWRTELPLRTHLRDIAPENRPPHGYPARAGRWPRGSALIHQPAGAAHAVFWFFGRGQKFRGWYVNLEHRTHHGEDIDVTDHELDVLVAPDRNWQWKDERSFAEKTGHPAYWSAKEAAAIRTEGRRLARLAETGAFPFDGSWCEFKPPPHWTTPPRGPAPVRTVLRSP
ncbi:DUF402 domain-containing protein [Streptomyces sp. NPDC060030]|uniref:DUF402 domain-containing protein n=1 Tax=Streptomyces sp. NPDC060030 TaxID=3347042 RepID=UPI0036972436